MHAMTYDLEAEAEVIIWIHTLTGELIPTTGFADTLRDGVLLCKLANAIKADSIVGYKISHVPFRQVIYISYKYSLCLHLCVFLYT